MPLTTISSLRVVNDPGEADRLIDVALNQLEAISEDHFNGRNFTIRDLIASDAPSSPTAIEWTDTPGTDNTWDDNTLWDGTAIADDTVMLLYGFSMPLPTLPGAPSATALRITVGASLRAQLDLYKILQFVPVSIEHDALTSGSNLVGYLVSPVIITSQQTVKIQQRIVTAGGTMHLVVHGFVAEIQGKTIEA